MPTTVGALESRFPKMNQDVLEVFPVQMSFLAKIKGPNQRRLANRKIRL